ncbi:ACT domain-containing protein [Planococcus sp. APC 4015]|nr:ACT domain-containing protein [Planococcus sp. APC 4015]
MTTLVFTIVGADRAGLVAEVADIVADHDGNWERSELVELSGTFAGVIEVSVSPARAGDLKAALSNLDGLLSVVVHEGSDRGSDDVSARRLTFDVLGNDRSGIVREITGALRAHGVSIDRLTTTTRDAAMYGGRLFEASVVTRVPESTDLDAVIGQLERLASEIQVDVSVGG